MPGPPPSRHVRRPRARADWVTLSPAGRGLPAPPWPIGRCTKQVESVWVQLWATPQATMWERLGWTRVVARYAKLLLAAEKSDAATTLLAEVRQMEDRLGLSPMAMRRLQWEMGEAGEPAQTENAEVTELDRYRELYG